MRVTDPVVMRWRRRDGSLRGISLSADGGYCLHAAVEQAILPVILPGRWANVPTGSYLMLAVGFEAQVRPLFELANRAGVTVFNAPGYVGLGEIRVLLFNAGTEPFAVQADAPIARLVIAPIWTGQLQEARPESGG